MISAITPTVQAKVESGVRDQVTAKVLETLGYSIEDYNNAVAAGLVDETTQAQVSGAIDAQMASDEVAATVADLTGQNMQSVEVQNGIADALAKAKAGRESIAALKTQLDSYNTFNKGLKTYTDGVGSASAGAAQLHSGTTQIKLGSSALKNGASDLKDGTEQLSEGADTLKNGILTMKNGVPALVDGVSRLRDGSMKLSDGLKQFNDEGISKITSLLKNDVGDLAKRLKATIKAAQNYKSYSGLTENMDGEVKFIYKTEEIQ